MSERVKSISLMNIFLKNNYLSHEGKREWVDSIEIDHLTVACLVAWPLYESEAGVDLVMLETSVLFLC